MQFKLDECVHIGLKNIFNDAGFEVDTVYYEDISGISDDNLIEKCKEENKILITVDLGFGNILKHPPHSHNGIILLKSDKLDYKSNKRILDLLIQFIIDKSFEEIKGSLVVIDKSGGIRIRR